MGLHHTQSTMATTQKSQYQLLFNSRFLLYVHTTNTIEKLVKSPWCRNIFLGLGSSRHTSYLTASSTWACILGRVERTMSCSLNLQAVTLFPLAPDHSSSGAFLSPCPLSSVLLFFCPLYSCPLSSCLPLLWSPVLYFCPLSPWFSA